VSPDPPWRLLAGVGRRKYRPPPTRESSPRNRENRGGPFAGDSPAGGLGGGGQPRRREARPTASLPRRPAPGAVTPPPRRRDGPHRGYVSPSSAQPSGRRGRREGRGGARPRASATRSAGSPASRRPSLTRGVRPRRLRSGPDESSPARVRVRPPGSPRLSADWRGRRSRARSPPGLRRGPGRRSTWPDWVSGRPAARGPGFRGGAGPGGGEGICETVLWSDYTYPRSTRAMPRRIGCNACLLAAPAPMITSRLTAKTRGRRMGPVSGIVGGRPRGPR
jgi:hypothetical protein